MTFILGFAVGVLAMAVFYLWLTASLHAMVAGGTTWQAIKTLWRLEF